MVEMGEKREWVKSEITELIEMYRDKPELWDVKCNMYKNRVKKRIALMEFAKKFSTSIEEITRKIHNLRNQYNGELKKIMKKSGQNDELFISKWPYFKSLSFLQGALGCRSATGNIESIMVNEQQYPTETQDIPLGLNDEADTLTDDTFEVNKSDTSNNRKRKQQIPTTVDPLTPKALRILTEEEDHFDIFGKYVASELRGVSHEHLRRKMKRKIQQVILDINDEEDQLLTASNIYSDPHSAASVCSYSSQLQMSPNVSPFLHIKTETEDM